MNNYPKGYQSMNLGLDGHNQECDDDPQDDGECTCHLYD